MNQNKLKSGDIIKSPICCVLGHVDTGKTKFLDKIRNTNIQNKEAGGITQQMGATYFSRKVLSKLTTGLIPEKSIKVPGILIMDTPGHEMFSNMRNRGSSICDIAILIVDINHGIEKQTIESMKLLKKYNTPYIIGLSKVDRIYDWKNGEWTDVKSMLDKQINYAMNDFWSKYGTVNLQFSENGTNIELFHQNKNFQEYVSCVPFSSITGDGIPDIFQALIGLTQKFMKKQITYREKTNCIILEVRKLEGVGTTLDIILSNGRLKIGDEIYVLTPEGYIKTFIKRIYSPPEGKEIRVKSDLIQHDEILASFGAKIYAEGVDDAIAGTKILKKTERNADLIQGMIETLEKEYFSNLKTKNLMGLHVQTSSMGSLEAVDHYLEEKGVSVGSKNLGIVNKKDLVKVIANIERDISKKYRVVLAFDVPISKEAKEEAIKNKITILESNHVYTLLDEYEKFCKKIDKEELEELKLKLKDDIQIPVLVQVIPKYVFNVSNPIVVGVKILKGHLYKNTKIRIRRKKTLTNIGKIIEIRLDNKQVDDAKEGLEVSIKIIPDNKSIMYGKQFDENDIIFTAMNRKTVEAVKTLKDEYNVNEKLFKKLIQANKLR